MDKHRETAIEILSLFEDLLNKHNIKIPDADREGNKDEACLYGSEYWFLEDEITEIISTIDTIK